MTDIILQLNNVTRSFGAVEVLQPLDIEIARGEFVAVVGPSGCGKTTLLNLLSGFDEPSSGKITRSGRMRMVYQNDGLFPWLTVRENIALGLRHVKGADELERQLKELIALIKLEGFEDHHPHKLSGGMRQRVEIARALAGDTDILLLDEPFSALDYLTRLRMRQELARMLDERPRTVVLVTHDIEEAAQLADRVIVFSERPAKVRSEVRLYETRPRDLTHPEVVKAVHGILTDLGLQMDSKMTAQLAADS
jgi:NitT/TauT family transport system ATP-binding protein